MKLNSNHLFILLCSFALFVILIIQINWIFETAKIKEELFNEKANMVLARTAEALSSDEATCKKIDDKIGQNEINKIDSLIKHYANFYNFHINYSFEVLNQFPFKFNLQSTSESNVFKKRLDEMVSKNGLVLKLIFPEKKQFILAEMGITFITSVILILLVLIMFWQTVLKLIKNKKILEQTTDFVNNMTHEFKTPITNIALAGRMIIKDSIIHQEEKVKYYSNIILEENEKLNQQVEEVLNITALEQGELTLQKTQIDLHQLIQQVLTNMHVQIEHAIATIKLSLLAKNFIIFGDKKHLTSAITNLIDNAIKYSNGQPEISFETSNNLQNIVLIISDKGIGIEKEFQTKIYEKYFRVPTGNLHEVKGFGIGLAYIKKIVELHQGSITQTSERGKGTSFTISLAYA